MEVGHPVQERSVASTFLGVRIPTAQFYGGAKIGVNGGRQRPWLPPRQRCGLPR
jgi:hypothetical protein